MTDEELTLDATKRYVRVIGQRGDFIEFEFAIGDPELFVELLLPKHVFGAFCATQGAILLEGARPERSQLDWTLHQANERAR
jgi:phenol hydroxylase P0 protein